MPRKLFLPTLAIALVISVASLLLSPLLALWLPGSWKRHVYEELSFRVIADQVLPASRDPEETIQAAINYTRRHLWLFGDSQPYGGTALGYLVEGVGWCDYHAKVFCRLLAARGLHARYDFLLDRQGISPHTVAEVYLNGKWRALDPFFDLIYANEADGWLALEDVTPDLVEQLPVMGIIREANAPLYESVQTIARRTFPLPHPPQRSDDFLTDRHVFDAITDGYFSVLGSGFARWYQDQFLRGQLATMQDPLRRLWCMARHYHLYRRLDEAEPYYRELLAQATWHRYRERVVLFYSRLLICQRRFADAKQLLQRFLPEDRDAPWLRFHLALCCEGLGQPDEAVQHYHAYQELHGKKYCVEAVTRLKRLASQRL